VSAVNQLIKQFGQMRKLLGQLAQGKMPDPQQLLKGMPR
jgi:signal recognition particle subunit SRP54